MSAKKPSPKAKPVNPPPTPAGHPAAESVPAAAAGGAAAEASVSWLESPDPRRRLIGKIVLAGIWVYVAALWLLALDQWFNWGIFGPKVPPVP